VCGYSGCANTAILNLIKESEVALSRISSGNINGSAMAKESANRIARRSK
jgi:hypothetical protein